MRAAALVAAAGASTRMGTCKALLPFSPDVVFAQRLAETYVAAGFDPIVVTVPDDEARIGRHLDHLPVVLSRNERPRDGLSGSVVTALEHAFEADALVVSPVDCPFLDIALLRSLLAALRVGAAAVPVVGDVRGHPAAFSRAAFELLWEARRCGGPRGVLAALGDDVIAVPWSDPRVCDDVDTPEDYERLFGRPLTLKRT